MRSTRLGLLASSPNCCPTKKRRTSRFDAPIRPCNSSSAKAIPLLRSASLNACGTWPSCSIVVPAMSITTSSTTLMISSSCLPATFSRHLLDLGAGGLHGDQRLTEPAGALSAARGVHDGGAEGAPGLVVHGHAPTRFAGEPSHRPLYPRLKDADPFV